MGELELTTHRCEVNCNLFDILYSRGYCCYLGSIPSINKFCEKALILFLSLSCVKCCFTKVWVLNSRQSLSLIEQSRAFWVECEIHKITLVIILFSFSIQHKHSVAVLLYISHDTQPVAQCPKLAA
jgi:hypothetical protein